MTPVTRHKQVKQGRNRRSEGAGSDRDQAKQSNSARPEAKPEFAQDHQPERPSRHGRQHGDRTLGRTDDVSEVEHPLDGDPGTRPKRSSRAQQIMDQGPGFKRPDDERRQRDGDEIGGHAVKSRLVEMV
jgi:hypothetical protein